MEGTVLRGIGSFYTVLEEGTNLQYTLRAQKKIRRQGTGLLVGDKVIFSPGTEGEEGWIEAVLPRKSLLERPSIANADLIVLVLAPRPQPDLLLIDRLIVRVKRGGMEPLICVNKIDINREFPGRIMWEYRKTGIHLLQTCTLTGEGLPELRESMKGRIACLAGQSAVGKSSLINALLGTALETGGLSHRTKRGRHTTRRCELLVKDGLCILDTPGFSLLELEDNIDPEELAELYEEYRALSDGCRFSPCLHDREPGCAVREAVESRKLDNQRWERYRVLLEEARQNRKGRYRS